MVLKYICPASLAQIAHFRKQRQRERPGAGEGLSDKFLSGTSDQSDQRYIVRLYRRCRTIPVSPSIRENETRAQERAPNIASRGKIWR